MSGPRAEMLFGTLAVVLLIVGLGFRMPPIAVFLGSCVLVYPMVRIHSEGLAGINPFPMFLTLAIIILLGLEPVEDAALSGASFFDRSTWEGNGFDSIRAGLLAVVPCWLCIRVEARIARRRAREAGEETHGG